MQKNRPQIKYEKEDLGVSNFNKIVTGRNVITKKNLLVRNYS